MEGRDGGGGSEGKHAGPRDHGPGVERRTGKKQALEEGRDNFLAEPRPLWAADRRVSPEVELQESQQGQARSGEGLSSAKVKGCDLDGVRRSTGASELGASPPPRAKIQRDCQ